MRRALALALLVLPALARADAFVAPEGKSGIEVLIGLENAADYPQYTFVAYRDCSIVEGGTHSIIAALDDDQGFDEHFEPKYGCDAPYLYAFPRDAFPLVDDELPPAATAQLTRTPPTDARVLRTHIDAEPVWWAPSELILNKIRDIYRVEITGASLKLTPTRVIFDFYNTELSRSFYKGKRPRIPRPSEVPPDPPSEPATPPAPAPSVSPTPPPVAAADAAPAPAEPSRVEDLLADIPPPLLYGGGCLLLALLAGLALRRR